MYNIFTRSRGKISCWCVFVSISCLLGLAFVFVVFVLPVVFFKKFINFLAKIFKGVFSLW
jgi:hypothetical protein